MRLVEKLNEKWGVFDAGGDLVVLPLHDLLCPMVWGDGPCGAVMLLHDFSCHVHVGLDPPLAHVDVHMKCPECGFHVTFGLSIPPRLAERLRRSRLHGRVLRSELSSVYGSLPPRVAERIRDWGYW